MATNLDVQSQINALLADQNKMLEESSKLLKDQVTITRELVTALRGASFKDLTSEAQQAQQAVQGISGATKDYGNTNQDVFGRLTTSMQNASKEQNVVSAAIEEFGKKSPKAFTMALSAVDGFVEGLKFTANAMHSITSVGAGLIGTLGHIGASIISIPFKMLTGLINMSDQGGGGDSGLRQALEDIRKEFGALHATSGKAIIDMAKSMKGELAESGLKVRRIFGNLAERLKAMQEYAHNLGPLFAALAGQFVKNAEAIGAYYKGLGLTEEGQKAVATRAKALGTQVTEELRTIANYSLKLSDAFGGAAGSAKEISRDMGKLMADFKHFGGISTKEISQTVVYFRRMGVEVEKVFGVIEKYDNFEDAANGAAHLSQAFNLNLDALELMKAQNPAQRVEMMRKAFFQAGRSVENMTRQERTLLAQQTGLDDSALDLVFSMKNQGMSYDQVTKKADAAKKKQLTQAEAMAKLADSIERMVKSGGGATGSGGFLDRFIQGFTVGIQRSHEFRKIMRELRMDLRTAYFEGVKVGKAFVEMFPGVKDVFEGIRDIFKPAAFKAMFRGVTETFKKFFHALTEDPKTALPKLLENLKKNFFSWFQGNSANGMKILDGYKKFFKTLIDIGKSMFEIAIKGLTDGVKFFTDVLSGKEKIGVGSQANGVWGFLSNGFKETLDYLKTIGAPLWKALQNLFSELIKKVAPFLTKSNIIRGIGVFLVPSFASMIAKTLIRSLGMGVLKGVGGFITGGGLKSAMTSLKGVFKAKVEDLTEHARRIPPPPPRVGGTGAAGAEAIKGANATAEEANKSKITPGTILKMALITLFVVAGMVALMGALFLLAKAIQENHITTQSILGASAAIIAASVSMLAISVAIKALSTINIKPGDVPKILFGLAAVGAVGVAMAVGAKLMIDTFGDTPTEKLIKTAAIMTASGVFFLTAAGIVAIAALVGAGLAATGGAGVVVLAAGLAALAATVAVMASEGLKIMESIDSFHPGTGFLDKTKAFVAVIKGVGEFAGSVGQIVEATKTSFLSFTSRSEQQQQTLGKVREVIEAIGGQMISIIEAIKNNIKELSGSEAQIKSAEIIGTLLGGIGALAQSLQAPAEALEEPGILDSNSDSVVNKVAQAANYMTAVSSSLQQFIGVIKNTVMQNIGAGISEDQRRVVELIPVVMTSVGQLITALKPDAATVKALTENGGDFGQRLLNIGYFVRTTLAAVEKSDIFSKVGDLIKNVVDKVKDLTPQEIRAASAIAPIIGPALTAVSSIASTLGRLTVPEGATNMPSALAIVALTNLVNTFFTRLGDSIPTLISSMRKAFSGITSQEAAGLASGMESLAKVFEVISQIPDTVKSFKGVGGVDAALGASINASLDGLTVLFDNPRTGLNTILPSIIHGIVAATSDLPEGLGAKLESLKSVFEALSIIPEIIQSFSQQAAKGGGAGRGENAIERTLTGLAETVTNLTTPYLAGGIDNPLVSGGLAGLNKLTGIPSDQVALLKNAIGSVVAVNSSTSELLSGLGEDKSEAVKTGLANVNTLISNLAAQLIPGIEGNLVTNVESLGLVIPQAIAVIEAASFAEISVVVRDMVAEVNRLSDQIRNIRPIGIETSLQSLGTNLGLGANGSYTIKNRNFKIDMNFSVKFDNSALEAFELSLLKRPGPETTRIKYEDK